MESLLERYAHHRFIIRSRNGPFPGSAAARTPTRATGETCQEIGKIDVVEGSLTRGVERAATRPEMLAPVGRRPEFLPGGVAAELIVRGALLGVAQCFIRL